MTTKKEHVCLNNRVLAVAVEGAVQDWAAYIGAIKGENLEEDIEEVARHGTKLPRRIAEYLFPSFAERLRWRQ